MTEYRSICETQDAAASPTFVYVTFIRTTPQKLWEALTSPEFTRQYWGVGLISDWQTGSTVDWDLLGKTTIVDPEQRVVEADPPHKLSYTWHTVGKQFQEAFGFPEEEVTPMSLEPRSTVTFELEPLGDVVKLTLTHHGFEPGSLLLAGITDGWPPIMASLKSLLETGSALPME